MFRSVTPGALALITTLVLGAPAIAASSEPIGKDDGVVVQLKITDADLHTPEGAKSLAWRIRVAATRLCGGEQAMIVAGEDRLQCREAAIDRAIRDLNSPLVADALGRAPVTSSLARSGH